MRDGIEAEAARVKTGTSRCARRHGWVCDDGRCVLCRAVDHATACGALVVAAVGNGHA